MKFFGLIISILVILPLQIHPQAGEKLEIRPPQTNYREFQKFTEKDGISNNQIRALFQDSRGFLYVGTNDGLNRFDGYEFVKYFHNPQESGSISDDHINSIFETKNGVLWISTRNGLNRFNKTENNFKQYFYGTNNPKSLSESEITAIFEDNFGNLWLGTREHGLCKLNESTESITPVSVESNSNEYNHIIAVAQESNGQLLLLTGSGLVRFNPQTEQFIAFNIGQNLEKGKSADKIVALMIDSKGFIWIGKTNGLERINPITNEISHYFSTQTINKTPNENEVYTIHEGKSGNIWVGMFGKFSLYQPETDSFIVYKNDNTRSRNNAFDHVDSIYEDASEQLWIGTQYSSLIKLNLKTLRFQRLLHDENDSKSPNGKEISFLFEDENGVAWAQTRLDGFNRYNPQINQFEEVNLFNGEYASATVLDRNGVRWFSTRIGNIFYFDKKSQKYVKFVSSNGVYPTPKFNIQKIIEDKDGCLWFSTSNGLYKLDPTTKIIKAYLHNPLNNNSLSVNRIHDLILGRDGEFWIATDSGFSKFEPKTETFTHFVPDSNNPNSLSGDEIFALHQDKEGLIWIASLYFGLNRYNPKTNEFKHYLRGKVLYRARLYGILDDNSGRLWVSSDKGLLCLNYENDTVQNFTIEDGLTNNELNEDALFKNKKGELYFGGIDGFVKFNPKDFVISQFKPQVHITNIRVLEAPYDTSKNVSELDEINLSWRDNVVSFDFAALDFTNPTKLKYQWKLEGHDNDWINGDVRRTATYANLAGGNFLLKVRASNSDGIWGDEITKLRINISPPFYRTIWFYLISLSLIGLTIWLIHRNRVNHFENLHKTQIQFSKLLIKSEEAERKRIASELHDGLGQNIVVIKNLALIAIKRLGGNIKTNKAIKELEQISESSTNVLDEVREITHNLRPPMLDRLGLTNTINSMLNKVSNVIKIENKIDSIDDFFDENDQIGFYRILQESINNILKHADATIITVVIKRDVETIVVEIYDNGKGFDIKKETSSKSGLGLISLKERAQLLNGKFHIDSQIGVGTVINFVFIKK